jgi:uncharacterized protein DUF3999
VNRAVLALFGLLLGAEFLQAQTLSPQDFAFGLPVITTKDAAAYRFSLPLAVYQSTWRGDLGDIRMFNARGDAVPFSLLRPTAQSSTHKVAQAVPLFPLHEGSRVVINGVRVTIDSPGSAIRLQARNAAAVARGQGPFLMVYGSAAAMPAETDLSQMPATLAIDSATLGSSQILGGATRLVARPAPFPWIRAVLWSVLLLAVILLAWMAYRLTRETSASSDA